MKRSERSERLIALHAELEAIARRIDGVEAEGEVWVPSRVYEALTEALVALADARSVIRQQVGDAIVEERR